MHVFTRASYVYTAYIYTHYVYVYLLVYLFIFFLVDVYVCIYRGMLYVFLMRWGI